MKLVDCMSECKCFAFSNIYRGLVYCSHNKQIDDYEEIKILAGNIVDCPREKDKFFGIKNKRVK